MEKFGIFDVIDKLTKSLTPTSEQQKPQPQAPKTDKKPKTTASNSAKLFLKRHEELSRKIDKNAKK